MKIADIQKKLLDSGIWGEIINHNNHFIGQDVLSSENKILSLTGFSGSAGTLFVTADKVFLFVDGRYEIQAKKETNNIEIICTKETSFISWMIQKTPNNAKIAYNSWTISIKNINTYKRYLPTAIFVPVPQLCPTADCASFEHIEKYAGMSVAQKTSLLKLDAPMLICAADSVSWLTNTRSDALPHTPILRAYALLGTDGNIELFADNSSQGKPLSELYDALAKQSSIVLDEHRTPDEIKQMLKKAGVRYQNMDDPVQNLKAVKNEIELEGFKNAHLKDGLALCKFLCWLQTAYLEQTELGLVEKLQAFRKQNDGYFADSFATIAAVGKNAAIVHYNPTPKTNATLEEGNILLLDSGGQYFEATTDATRTVATGKGCSDEMKNKFTLVLKAHIALSSQKFPIGTHGVCLDAICRSVLWRHNLDYAHGTGHGVGCFLSVHEGPQSMSPAASTYPLQKNMILSIEPGYYKENAFGIRIENLVYVAVENENFLKFVPLTLAPIDKNLISVYILSDEEIIWLNEYHALVFAKISPYLEKHEQVWLEDACSPIER